MEPNKLEQEFKNKLEQRTIAPSAMAWDRLDAMLSVSEKKKQPKRRTWMYVAASFLGFMLVGAILLKQEKENTGNTIETTIVNADQPADNKEAQPVQAKTVEETLETTMAPAKQEAVAVNKSNRTVKKQSETDKVYNTGEQHNVNPSVTKSANDAIAVQEVQEPQNKSAEELLAASLNNPSKKKSSIKVDASSLLSSVEGELDNNFRNEVLQKVVKNYNTVKTSVANRNYEHR
jgi:hypothetical protein